MRFLRKRSQAIYAGAIVFGCALLFLGTVLFLPSTGVYQAVVQGLWNAGWRQAAYALNFNDANLAMQEGNYYFAGGAYVLPKAERAISLAIKLRPTAPMQHYMLARVLFSEGKFDEALTAINTELQINPENQRSLYVRGLIYLYRQQSGDLGRAAADFSQFTKWAPGEWAGYNDLAFTLEKEAEFPAAVRVLTQALSKVPQGTKNAWLWNSLGVAQLNLLEYPQAINSFKNALALAKKLTTVNWRRDYSGDNPANDSASLRQFITAIQKNLTTAQNG